MARKLGGDPAATDSTRVLRLPGFINRKYKTDFRVQAEKHTDRIHHLQDFRLCTEPIANNFRAHYRLLTQRSSETRPLSQSEHDWIYAKRALARGDDPEEIIRRIADFRSSEKRPAVLRAANRQQSAAAPCDGKKSAVNQMLSIPDPLTSPWQRREESVFGWKRASPLEGGPLVRAISSLRRSSAQSRRRSSRAGLLEFLPCRRSGASGLG